jgi:hypothetical protein
LFLRPATALISVANCSIWSDSRWAAPDALAPGKHTIVFDFTYDGPGIGKGGAGVLKVDDKEVANQKIPHTIAFLILPDETFDVGVDTRTPVDDNDYQVPFRFTGKLAKLTFNLGPEQLTAEDRKVISERLRVLTTSNRYSVNGIPVDIPSS